LERLLLLFYSDMNNEFSRFLHVTYILVKMHKEMELTKINSFSRTKKLFL
jgi:hypothetical protein